MPRCIFDIVLLAGLCMCISCSDNGVWSLPDVSPPVVNITNPADGDTIYSNPLITVLVEDESEIRNVSYHIEDVLIGEDLAPPYEEVWYAGYWPEGKYELYAKAEDALGYTGISDTLVLYVSPEARIVPELHLPMDSTYIASFTTLTFTCHPCPGARSYMLEWRCVDCDYQSEWYGTKYIGSSSNQIFVFISMPSPQEDIEIEWRCQAKWSIDYVSHWSEKRILFVKAGS